MSCEDTFIVACLFSLCMKHNCTTSPLVSGRSNWYLSKRDDFVDLKSFGSTKSKITCCFIKAFYDIGVHSNYFLAALNIPD